MSQSFWPIYPVAVSALGYVCFYYAKPMRKLILYAGTTFLIIVAFIATYGLSAINALNKADSDRYKRCFTFSTNCIILFDWNYCSMYKDNYQIIPGY